MDDLVSTRLELLRQVCNRTRRFTHLAQLDCGELNGDFSALFGFKTWFCRTAGEIACSERLQALLQNEPAVSARFVARPNLLCLRQRIPSGFLFLLHGHGGGGRGREARGGVHTQYNSYMRQAMRWMERYSVLLEYHNSEVECVCAAGFLEMYALLTAEWAQNLLYPWNSFYDSMPPSLTYLAHEMVSIEPYANTAWRVAVTERVALLSME